MKKFLSRKWSDAEKWGMGILGGLILAASIGAFTYLFSGQLFGLQTPSQTGYSVISELLPDEFVVVEKQPFCSLSATPESVEPGELYRLEWKGDPNGTYTFGGQKVGPVGFIEYTWQDQNVFLTFELRGELNGSACIAHATVFENIEEPKCFLRTTTGSKVVEKGGEFTVEWFGHPRSNTIFRLNDQIVVPRDGQTFTWPIDHDDPIKLIIRGDNLAGSCEHQLTIWPK